MSSESRIPTWIPPTGVKPQLIVNNSMTQAPVPFVPKSGNAIGWYSCGPTVYDSAHLGHARAYVTFDIIRRILSDFFNFDIFYVMNITDVDDKIILKARRNYLWEQYELTAVKADPNDIINDSITAFQTVITEGKEKIENLKLKISTASKRYLADLQEQFEQTEMKQNVVEKEFLIFQDIQSKYTKDGLTSSEFLKSLLIAAKPALVVWLDAKDGHSVSDQSIYKKLSEKYEAEFLEDLTQLGVRDVDALTRVTEYIQPIITFVEKIIDNGYAYESGGSVYFDTNAFMTKKDENGELANFYAKLKPTAVGNIELAAEGEGSLGSTGEKRNVNDFALWKSSKPGEPRWESPWGLGRPGWHIECSAMATDLLGTQFDIHTGGDDLKFPHHDNELAQSEAYSGVYQWVNYFFHAGRLNIAGLKMSKSLKNFITIRQVLEQATSRQIRLLFLSQHWDSTMNFDDASLQSSRTVERSFKSFFQNIQILNRKFSNQTAHLNQFWSSDDHQLQNFFAPKQSEFYTALCNNFNTPQAMTILQDLVSESNKYLAKFENSSAASVHNNGQTSQNIPKMLLLNRIAQTINRYLKIFGVVPDHQSHFLDLYNESQEGTSGSANETTEKIIDIFSSFRDRVRSEVKSTDPSKLKGNLMTLCDVLRDDELIELGIKLEDKIDGSAVWKLDDPVELKKQRQEKINIQKEKEKTKLETKIKDFIRFSSKYKVSYVTQTLLDKYSKFDKTGIPTHLLDGSIAPEEDVKQSTQNLSLHPDIYSPDSISLFLKYSTFIDQLPIMDHEGVEVTKSKSSGEKKQLILRKKDFEELSKKAQQANVTPIEYIKQIDIDLTTAQKQLDSL